MKRQPLELTAEERRLVIEYRKHDEARRRAIRILLDMQAPQPYKTDPRNILERIK